MGDKEPIVLPDIEDHVATVTLNRPAARNALSRELTYTLRDTAAAVGADPSVAVVILTGADPALLDGRRRAGKPMTGFTVKAAVYLATGDEQEMAAAVRQIRSGIAFYASTPSRAGRWAEMNRLIDDDMLRAFAVVASPEEVPALLAQRCAGVVDVVSFLGQQPSPALLAAVRSVSSLSERPVATADGPRSN